MTSKETIDPEVAYSRALATAFGVFVGGLAVTQLGETIEEPVIALVGAVIGIGALFHGLGRMIWMRVARRRAKRERRV